MRSSILSCAPSFPFHTPHQKKDKKQPQLSTRIKMPAIIMVAALASLQPPVGDGGEEDGGEDSRGPRSNVAIIGQWSE
eukprot:jgi/Chrpa1/1910/Chrysochromulina_OHIO_Genome00011250-RA